MQTVQYHTHGLAQKERGQIDVSPEEIAAIIRLRTSTLQAGDEAVIQALIARVRSILDCTTGKEKVIFSWDIDLGVTFDRGPVTNPEDGTTPPIWKDRYFQEERPDRVFGLFIHLTRPHGLPDLVAA